MTAMVDQENERQRILILEVSPLHRRSLHDALQLDYDLSWASNARDALALAFTQRPHLIIADVQLDSSGDGEDGRRSSKNITGLDVCRQINKSGLKGTPVIILTASGGLSTRLKARAAHASEFLTKPMETRQLVEYVHKYLGSPRVRTLLNNIEQQYSGQAV